MAVNLNGLRSAVGTVIWFSVLGHNSHSRLELSKYLVPVHFAGPAVASKAIAKWGRASRRLEIESTLMAAALIIKLLMSN